MQIRPHIIKIDMKMHISNGIFQNGEGNKT